MRAAVLSLVVLALPAAAQIKGPSDVTVAVGRLAAVPLTVDGEESDYVCLGTDVDCFREYTVSPKEIRLRVIGYAPGTAYVTVAATKGGKLQPLFVVKITVTGAPVPPPVPPGPVPPPDPVPPLPPDNPPESKPPFPGVRAEARPMTHKQRVALAVAHRRVAGALAKEPMTIKAIRADLNAEITELHVEGIPAGLAKLCSSILGAADSHGEDEPLPPEAQKTIQTTLKKIAESLEAP